MLFAEIVVRLLKSPEDSDMSLGDFISLGSALISAAAIGIGVWQFREGLKADRIARAEDAVAARQLRQEDAMQARVERAEDAHEQRQHALEDARKAWLANVIIQPNLPLIHGFFNDLSDFTSLAIDGLTAYSGTYGGTSQELTDEKLAYTGKLNRKKQEFDYAFVSLIEAQNRAFGLKLRSWLNDLDDIISNPLGDIGIVPVVMLDVERHIFEHKALFFSLLYDEMRQASA